MQMPLIEAVFTLAGVDPITALEEKNDTLYKLSANMGHIYTCWSSLWSDLAPLGDLHAPTEEDLWFCFTPER